STELNCASWAINSEFSCGLRGSWFSNWVIISFRNALWPSSFSFLSSSCRREIERSLKILLPVAEISFIVFTLLLLPAQHLLPAHIPTGQFFYWPSVSTRCIICLAEFITSTFTWNE